MDEIQMSCSDEKVGHQLGSPSNVRQDDAPYFSKTEQ